MAIEDHVVTELEGTPVEVDLGIGGVPFLYEPAETAPPCGMTLTATSSPSIHLIGSCRHRQAFDAGRRGGNSAAFGWRRRDNIVERITGYRPTILMSESEAGAKVVAHIQRHRLLRTAEEMAEARSRLILARDLHDSVVQFLAGAAFRLEAMKKSDFRWP